MRRRGETLKTICFCLFTLGPDGSSCLHRIIERCSLSSLCLILVLTVLAVCKIKPFLGDRKNGGSTVGPGDIFPGKMMTNRTKPPWVSLSSCHLGRLSPGVHSECIAIESLRSAVRVHQNGTFSQAAGAEMTSHFTLGPIHPHLCIWLFSLEGIFNRGSTTLAQHPHCKGRVWHSMLRTPISRSRVLWLFTSSFHFFRVLFCFVFQIKLGDIWGPKPAIVSL